ncbi:MAG: SCO family protein [Nitrospira sp.]|nr:SCO family protein [Nitrospira sp.]
MMLRFVPAAMLLWLCGAHAAPAWSGVTPPSIPDVEVIDQDGVPHRFYGDMVKGKTVVINFIYTTCKTSCPAATGLLSGVYHRLQAAERPVTLLSVTVDPVHDRPTRLKAYAAQFGAGKGWYFLTGAPADVARILASLQVSASNKAEHPAIVVIGNEAAGIWTRLYGEASVPMVMDGLDATAGLPALTPSGISQ